jgi:hypothetical protein
VRGKLEKMMRKSKVEDDDYGDEGKRWMKMMVMIHNGEDEDAGGGRVYLFDDLANGIESHHTRGLVSTCVLGLGLCVVKQKHISFSPILHKHT